jgi:hypothetical protein
MVTIYNIYGPYELKWAENNIGKPNILCYTCLERVVVVENYEYLWLICKYVQYSTATTEITVTSYQFIRVMYGQCFRNAVHVYEFPSALDLEFLLFCCFLLFWLELYQTWEYYIANYTASQDQVCLSHQIMGILCSQQLYIYIFFQNENLKLVWTSRFGERTKDVITPILTWLNVVNNQKQGLRRMSDLLKPYTC